MKEALEKKALEALTLSIIDTMQAFSDTVNTIRGDKMLDPKIELQIKRTHERFRYSLDWAEAIRQEKGSS